MGAKKKPKKYQKKTTRGPQEDQKKTKRGPKEDQKRDKRGAKEDPKRTDRGPKKYQKGTKKRPKGGQNYLPINSSCCVTSHGSTSSYESCCNPSIWIVHKILNY